jgi:hypothetical protein
VGLAADQPNQRNKRGKTNVAFKATMAIRSLTFIIYQAFGIAEPTRVALLQLTRWCICLFQSFHLPLVSVGISFSFIALSTPAYGE